METTRAERIANFLPLVQIIAYSLRSQLPFGVAIEDLVAAGRLALVAAVDRFDPSHGVKIRTFLNYRIRGAMLDEIRAIVGRQGTAPGNAKRAAYLNGIALDALHPGQIGLALSHTPEYPDHFSNRRLAEGLTTLTKREREVLHAVYHGGLTQEQVGKLLGVHPSRVSQLRTVALRKLAVFFAAATRDVAASNR